MGGSWYRTCFPGNSSLSVSQWLCGGKNIGLNAIKPREKQQICSLLAHVDTFFSWLEIVKILAPVPLTFLSHLHMEFLIIRKVPHCQSHWAKGVLSVADIF